MRTYCSIVGDTVFEVEKRVPRCLVTHANPATGQRDHDVMNTLTRKFGQEVPEFAVRMKRVSGPLTFGIGSSVEVE